MRFIPTFLSGGVVGAAVCAGAVLLRNSAPEPVAAAPATPAAPSLRETALADQADRLQKEVARLQKDLIEEKARAEEQAATAQAAAQAAATNAVATIGKPATDLSAEARKPPDQAVPGFLEGLLSSLPFDAVVTVNGEPAKGSGLDELVQKPMRNQAIKTSVLRARYYSSSLGLTPDQEKQLGEHFLEREANDLNDLPRLIRQQMENAKNPGAAETAERDRLATLLSPEQLQAFDTMREAERRASTEADALSEVARLRRAVPDLSAEQRDQIYARALEKGPASPLATLPGVEPAANPYEDLLSPSQQKSYEALAPSFFGPGIGISTQIIRSP